MALTGYGLPHWDSLIPSSSLLGFSARSAISSQRHGYTVCAKSTTKLSNRSICGGAHRNTPIDWFFEDSAYSWLLMNFLEASRQARNRTDSPFRPWMIG